MLTRRDFLQASTAVLARWRPSVQVLTPGRSFFVDSDSGDDGNPGTSEASPWRTLTNVNASDLKPGDQVLLKAGSHFLGQLYPKSPGESRGTNVDPIRIRPYGTGPKPLIAGEGKYKAAVYLYNFDVCEISDIEITNQGTEREAERTGVLVQAEDFGTAHDIRLLQLFIHDVNGSLVKEAGGGQGILWQNEAGTRLSRFDGLLIEGCHVARCERNGIMGYGNWDRARWYPSLHVIVRNNLIEEIPGDAIVPIGCENALIERNVVRNFTRLLPDTEAAAGIWPWGCDGTVIQFNEVSDHKSPTDAQGLDSDWDCRRTVIQYNYSHDNEGGFLLVCNNGGAEPRLVLCDDTVVRYNISINDGLRTIGPKAGFSPAFHISGPVRRTRIYNNLVYVPAKPKSTIDTTMIKMDNWGGPWPTDTWFANNIFFVVPTARYSMGGSERNVFTHNVFFGQHLNPPDDPYALAGDPLFRSPVSAGQAGFEQLIGFMPTKGSPCVGSAGAVSDNGGRDFFGNPVGAQGPKNIGVSEAVYNRARRSRTR